MSEKKGFLTGPDGEKSSKRLFGSISMSAGILIFIALGAVGFFKEVADLEAVKVAAFGLTGIGGGVLGIGVLEHIRPRAAGRGPAAPQVENRSGGRHLHAEIIPGAGR